MIDRESSRLGKSWRVLFLVAVAGMALVIFGDHSPGLLAAIFLLAIFKSRLIVLDFMGFRDRHAALRHGLVAWSIVLAFAAVVKLFLAGATG